MNRCLPLASLDPFLSVTFEAERVHDEAGGVQHIPSLDKASSVGLSVGLLDDVAHGVCSNALLMAQVYTTQMVCQALRCTQL